MVGRGLAAAPGVDPTTTVGYPEDREAAVGPKLSPAQSRAQHHRSPAASESSTGPVAGGGAGFHASSPGTSTWWGQWPGGPPAKIPAPSGVDTH